MADEAVKKVRKRNDIKGTGQNWRKGKLKRTPDEVKEAFKDYAKCCADEHKKRLFLIFSVYLTDLSTHNVYLHKNFVGLP